MSLVSSPPVDGDEQEQPHHVDEVPVPGRGFKPEVMGFREVVGHQSGQTHRQEAGSNEHVESMESRGHVER